MPDKIRVGLIRCDTHGMWFAALMAEHDALRLRQPMPVEEEMHYSWQRAGVHYFFYTHYCDPQRMTANFVGGFRIAKVWDEDRRSAEMFSRVFLEQPQVCETFEEVSDDVDLVFIADCNGDGHDHLRFARPGLEKGIPTFIDKPFAHNLEDALAIRNLAKQHGAPLLSLSILQTNPAAERFSRRLDEVGKVTFGTATCFNSTAPPALIHAISIVHHVFGAGIQRVTCLKAPGNTSFHLHYGGRYDRPVNGVMIHCNTADFRFTKFFATACGNEGMVMGQVLDDFDASDGTAIIIEHIKEMVRIRTTKPLGDEMLQAIAVMEAAQQSEASGQPVAVVDVLV